MKRFLVVLVSMLIALFAALSIWWALQPSHLALDSESVIVAVVAVIGLAAGPTIAVVYLLRARSITALDLVPFLLAAVAAMMLTDRVVDSLDADPQMGIALLTGVPLASLGLYGVAIGLAWSSSRRNGGS